MGSGHEKRIWIDHIRMKKECAQCSSDEIIEGLRVADQYVSKHIKESLSIEIRTRPQSTFNPGDKRYELKAAVCIACGTTRLNVDNPQSLKESYETYLKNR